MHTGTIKNKPMTKTKTPPIQQLYYRYKQTDDSDIKKYLAKIMVVHKKNNTYYPLDKKSMKFLKSKPRANSLTFDATTVTDTPISNLQKFKTITYLVKSSSRFFLKPDIGEIFDQIEFDDLHGNKLKAICFNGGHRLLDGTQGEHFLMKVDLLTEKI